MRSWFLLLTTPAVATGENRVTVRLSASERLSISPSSLRFSLNKPMPSRKRRVGLEPVHSRPLIVMTPPDTRSKPKMVRSARINFRQFPADHRANDIRELYGAHISTGHALTIA